MSELVTYVRRVNPAPAPSPRSCRGRPFASSIRFCASPVIGGQPLPLGLFSRPSRRRSSAGPRTVSRFRRSGAPVGGRCCRASERTQKGPVPLGVGYESPDRHRPIGHLVGLPAPLIMLSGQRQGACGICPDRSPVCSGGLAPPCRAQWHESAAAYCGTGNLVAGMLVRVLTLKTGARSSSLARAAPMRTGKPDISPRTRIRRTGAEAFHLP